VADPHGFAACIRSDGDVRGRTCNVFASETCAFDLINAVFEVMLNPAKW
jgi:hypothetical protein